MVGQHPELAGLPELKQFAYDTIGELEASLPPYWAARAFPIAALGWCVLWLSSPSAIRPSMAYVAPASGFVSSPTGADRARATFSLSV